VGSRPQWGKVVENMVKKAMSVATESTVEISILIVLLTVTRESRPS
jgi:hypothetical protein